MGRRRGEQGIRIRTGRKGRERLRPQLGRGMDGSDPPCDSHPPRLRETRPHVNPSAQLPTPRHFLSSPHHVCIQLLPFAGVPNLPTAVPGLCAATTERPVSPTVPTAGGSSWAEPISLYAQLELARREDIWVAPTRTTDGPGPGRGTRRCRIKSDAAVHFLRAQARRVRFG